MKKLLLFFSFLMIISCSKTNVEEESDVTLVTYQLSILASEGGTVSFDNPNNGLFETGSRVIIEAIPDEGFYFTEWSNGSRENPLTINIESDVTIFPKFLNKLNLIKRFSEIVIGDGENGPMHTLRWKAMKISIQGASSEIEKELDVFIEELNTILSNDNQFNCEKVTDNYGVHMVNSTAEEFLNIYPEYENNGIELEDFWGYASWSANAEGYINEGRVFLNEPEMTWIKAIKWTIRHELGHVLGLKHTPDETSIMHPLFYENINEGFSELDKESLRFLHDSRMPLKSDLESSNAILKNILGVNSSKKILKNFKVNQKTKKISKKGYDYKCHRI